MKNSLFSNCSLAGIAGIVAVLLGLLCIFSPLAGFVSAEDRAYNSEAIEYLDEVKLKAAEVTAATATVATILAVAPGDSTTPIANQIANMGIYMVIIVALIVFEKYLLTSLEFIAIKWIASVGLILLGMGILSVKSRKELINFGAKLLIFAIVISLIIPFSTTIGSKIYSTQKESVDILLADSEEFEAMKIETKEDHSGNFVNRIVSKVENTAAAWKAKAKNTLNRFIDAIAVLIITTCLIPLFVLFGAVWAINLLFGIEIPVGRGVDIGKRKRNIIKGNGGKKFLTENKPALLTNNKK